MSTDTKQVLVEIDKQKIATITLNRAEKRNAFDEHVVNDLRAALASLADNADVRIILLRSTGTHFSAGGDLAWLQKTKQYSEKENKTDALALAQLMYELYHINKPTIAVVQGPAYGGALGLIACCQIAIAASEATFCFSELKLGLLPAVISPYIVNAIGYRQARAHFLTGEIFNAEKALAMGLCHRAVPLKSIEDTTQRIIDKILNNGPEAIAALGPFMSPFQPVPITPELTAQTAQAIANLRTSSEGQEGLNAFLEKRPPNWSQIND